MLLVRRKSLPKPVKMLVEIQVKKLGGVGTDTHIIVRNNPKSSSEIKKKKKSPFLIIFLTYMLLPLSFNNIPHTSYLVKRT